jgi:hypothetical protein
MIPRKCLFIEAIEDEAIDDKETIVVELGKGSGVRSKILIKGKISLSPMETILTIPKELESLESLVKLTKKKKDEGLKVVI